MNSDSIQVDSKSPNAEVSPEGHWSKNFAALSIHRRKDWAVTVKGFNRFVWDFEGSTGSARPENVFGTFASHGSMLIANSEEVLKAHDINNGWDWTKIPGATTMSLTLPQIRLRKARNFSPRSFAGGVSYKGTASLPSGVFGMDFHQPNYQFQEERHPHPSIKLHFKKSVFFYQNLVVCLGSNITIENGGDTKAQTTLFQDKLNRGGDSTFFIKVDDVRKDSMDQFATMNPLSINRNKKYTTLIDTKGNSYYIPESSAKNLRVHVQTQNSQTPAAEVSSGIYATAWIEHTSPNGFYEYAIWINTDSYPNTAEKMWARQTQENNPRPYQILKQDDEAHVVQFNVIPESGKNRPIRTPLYGYVFFKSATPFYEQGPIEKVNMQCRIMAEETVNFVYLSVSYPDLNFPLSKVIESSSDIKARELFQTESNEMELVVTLKNDVLKCSPEVLKVFGSPTGYVPHIRVESSSYYGSGPYKGNIIVFSNLKNGFSVEVKFKNA